MSLRLKSWFSQITATAIKAGTRYRDGDKPPSATFADHLESSVFKTESEDRAKVDEGGFNPLNNGHVVLATGTQVKDYSEQPSDRSLTVQPEQVTEVASGANITIDDFTGPSMKVEKDANEERRNKYLLNFSDEFQAWIADKLGNKFLSHLTTTLTESLDSDVDIVVVVDTTSLSLYKTTIIQEMTAWYNSFIAVNPWYQGNISFYDDGTERWLQWPRVHCLGNGKTKALLIGFIDEAAGEGNDNYHGFYASVIATEVPRPDYKTDFNDFVGTDYAEFEYFAGIIYGVPVQSTESNAVFHAHTYKAITRGLVAPTDFIESPVVVLKGYSLDFMKTSNVYADLTGSADPSGSYDGLVDYGWSEYHDFEPDDITNKLTRGEFDNRIQNTLFGEGRTNILTVNIEATMNDDEEINTEFEIKLPVAQISFDQYKDLPNPTSTADIDLYASGSLYYMTVAQIWGAGNAPDGEVIMADDHKILFVKD